MCVVGFKSITCQADQWCEDHPAELPPATWPVADHVLNVLIKPFSSCGTKTGGQKEACIFLALRLRLQDYNNRQHEATKKRRGKLIGQSYRKKAKQINVISCCTTTWEKKSTCLIHWVTSMKIAVCTDCLCLFQLHDFSLD